MSIKYIFRLFFLIVISWFVSQYSLFSLSKVFSAHRKFRESQYHNAHRTSVQHVVSSSKPNSSSKSKYQYHTTNRDYQDDLEENGCKKSNNPIVFNTRNDFGELLENEGAKIGVELGVQEGIFAEHTLKHWHSAEKYVLVDAWKPLENYEDLSNKKQTEHDKLYDKAMWRLSQFHNVDIDVCRNFTSKCAIRFPNEYFDYIYVDARHDFKGVTIDLNGWWPKLKPGGIFAGHDYVTQFEGPEQTGQNWTKQFDGSIDYTRTAVKGAVQKFAKFHKLKICTQNKNTSWPSWAIRKPSKNVIDKKLKLKPFNTCVVSFIFGKKFSVYKNSLAANKEKYCARHSYKCFIYQNLLVPQTRPLAWQKIEAIKKVMQHPKCKTIFWIDGDAVFINMDMTIPKPTKQISLCRSRDGLNSGVMIIKNTPWATWFFNRVSNMHKYDNHHWWEQAAMINLDKHPRIRNHISTIPNDIYNSNRINKKTFIYHPWLCGGFNGKSWYGKLKCNDLWKIALTKVSYCGVIPVHDGTPLTLFFNTKYTHTNTISTLSHYIRS